MINLALNTLFYNDDIINQIYATKGKFDLEFQIWKTLYSTLISIALNKVLKMIISFFLSLLYPLIINLTSGLFRIHALSKAKWKELYI